MSSKSSRHTGQPRSPQSSGGGGLETAVKIYGKLPLWLQILMIVIVLAVVGGIFGGGWHLLSRTPLGLIVMLAGAAAAFYFYQKDAAWWQIGLAILGAILGLVGTIQFVSGLGWNWGLILLWAGSLAVLATGVWFLYNTLKEG